MTAKPPSSRNSDVDGSDALEQALALYSMPGNVCLLRVRPLPGSVLQLIRVAAGDRDALESATARTGEMPGHIVEAAVSYIQQVFFHDSADSYRTLGVNPDASSATIKEHYRRLMHWLHPDRNPGRWESGYSERVNRAWKSLSTEQRRREYDARPCALVLPQPDPMPEAVTPSRSFESGPPPKRVVLSPRTARLLPAIVFGVLAVLASLVVVESYRSRLAEQANMASAAARLDAALPNDDDSAQKAAIRNRIAFEEHVAELSRTADDHEPLASAPPSAQSMLGGASDAGEPATATSGADGMAKQPTGVPTSAEREQMLVSRPDAAQSPPDRPSPAPMAAVVPASEASTELSHEFAAAYARGDLHRMLGLFTPDAVGNRGGIDSIATDYGNLFANTTTRELNLDGLSWTFAVDRIVGSGEFTARIRMHDELVVRDVKGWIRIEAIPVDGHWKIQRIERENSQ